MKAEIFSCFQPCTEEGVVICQVKHEEESHGIPKNYISFIIFWFCQKLKYLVTMNIKVFQSDLLR